ncbi:unnamed protein product [Allacma fusca]|uniref:Uncharacterized protein n=1 Tax=Allacma fusca TaxID=39272 RepID=A0A8J2L2K6_9HEXA|nr:unnamed protein product [Allacma fusca]
MDLMQRIPLKDANRTVNLPKTHSDYARFSQDASFVSSIPSKKLISSLLSEGKLSKKQSSSKLPRYNKSQTIEERKKQIGKIPPNFPSTSQTLKTVGSPVSTNEERNDIANASTVNNENPLLKEDND